MMAKNKDRKHKQLKALDTGKLTGKAKRPESDNVLYPEFDFSKTCLGYRAADLTHETKSLFGEKLYEMSALKWGDLNQADRKGQGFEKINQSSLTVALPSGITPDVTIISFQKSDLRLIGYRERHVFRILWLDSRFQVYKH